MVEHEEKIVNHIIESKGESVRFIAAICGAADTGKSYLSRNIAAILNQSGYSTGHLPLDSFLMNRAERIKKGISGYDIESYDVKAAGKLLNKFYDGEDIHFFPYNHATGEKTKNPSYLKNSDVLIFDGLHSMHQAFQPYINFSIFVYTNDKQLREIRQEADILKRKQTLKMSKVMEPVEYRKYKRRVEPYKKKADLHLFLKEKWYYKVKLNPL